MIDNIAGALGGTVANAGAALINQAAGGNNSPDTKGLKPMPKSMDAIPAWGIAMSLGETLAKSFLEKNPEWAEAMDEEELTGVMQALMNEVTSSLGKSLEFLKEDDDEEGSKIASLYSQ